MICPLLLPVPLYGDIGTISLQTQGSKDRVGLVLHEREILRECPSLIQKGAKFSVRECFPGQPYRKPH